MEGEIKMEIYEKGKNIIIEIPALDMNLEDIKINIKNNHLKIQGNKKITKEAKKEGYYAKEEKENAFLNEVTLPFEVQGDKAKKIFKQGILMISMPKKK